MAQQARKKSNIIHLRCAGARDLMYMTNVANEDMVAKINTWYKNVTGCKDKEVKVSKSKNIVTVVFNNGRAGNHLGDAWSVLFMDAMDDWGFEVKQSWGTYTPGHNPFETFYYGRK